MTSGEMVGPTNDEARQPELVLHHLAQGEASLMLLESLMMALVDRKVLSSAELIESIETVIEAKRQMISDQVHPHISTVAAGILSAMANSLGAARPKPSS